jgi:SAM-dependent methyltransferase
MLNKEFYRNARAYDIAFSDREFDVECDFLEYAAAEFGTINLNGPDNKSFVELGCGPGRHAREMARRGWRSTALDISQDMIEFAVEEARRKNLKIEPVVADMCDYTLSKPVALSATLMESISHLVTNEQMVSHFKAVARNTVPGGIYVIEATHPLFFFPDNEVNTWVSRKGKTRVEITFGLPTDEYNSVKQQWMITSRLKIKEGENPEAVVENKSPIRWWLAQEMLALIELAGVFNKCWLFGSMYTIPPVELDDSEDSDAMVIILRVK